VLLKAILQSQGYDCNDEISLDPIKMFVINDVIVPKDYKFFKKHLGWQKKPDMFYNSNIDNFDDIPIANSIKKRYKNQQSEKQTRKK